MSPRDRKIVLVALLFTVAGGAAYWQLSGGVFIGGANAGPGDKPVVIPPAARIMGDSLIASDDNGSTSGRNIFSFGREIIVAPPPPPVVIDQAPPPPPVISRPPQTQPTPVVSNPTANLPARVQLQYTGYARDDASDKMLAILETSGTGAGHYLLREDDFLLGRIRVKKITPDSVEVEDLERSETSTIAISPTLAQRR
ncbi:MAG TPA: hypothetical protein VFY29_19245 [Terriglobia bacterium]|nr:hypothetical protein [Terriglobia bacterium]